MIVGANRMRKIHVVTQKELVEIEKLHECTAVVIDVFLATSTIILALDQGFTSVQAVKDAQTALSVAKSSPKDSYLLLGESKGEEIDGFIYPDPSLLFDKKYSKEKELILCSTNGTVAINLARESKTLFISSLINGQAAAKRIHGADDSSIVFICSGNDNRFSLEDYIGAGQVIHYLRKHVGEYSLSDSAIGALLCYESAKERAFSDLYRCETARMLADYGFEQSIDIILENVDKIETVPIYHNGKMVKEISNLK
jgi:2-phosphosulfolactate phosphatase